MKRLALPLVAFALLTIPSALSATTKNVDITTAGFTPNRVTIDFGDTVTWTNKDSVNHQVLADQLAFPTSAVLAPNQTYSYTFTKSGSFGYRMRSIRTVAARSSSAPASRSVRLLRWSRTASPRRSPVRRRPARRVTP
jgi:hypothetical protein